MVMSIMGTGTVGIGTGESERKMRRMRNLMRLLCGKDGLRSGNDHCIEMSIVYGSMDSIS
jgi:hypothetical protein